MTTANAGYDFVRIKRSEPHILALYELLQKRSHPISHTKLPGYTEHTAFVINHPYRAWYLIRTGGAFTGTVYLLKDNSIGISIANGDCHAARESIAWIRKKYKPLSAVKSIRTASFHVNVALDNTPLKQTLEDIGAIPVQLTYAIL